jgi:hypothetical protein
MDVGVRLRRVADSSGEKDQAGSVVLDEEEESLKPRNYE